MKMMNEKPATIREAADVYVDAKAVNSLGDSIERSLGWDLEAVGENSDLFGGVKPRHFNAIRRVGDDHVEKTGPRRRATRSCSTSLQHIFDGRLRVRETLGDSRVRNMGL